MFLYVYPCSLLVLHKFRIKTAANTDCTTEVDKVQTEDVYKRQDNTHDKQIEYELEQKDHARAAFYRYYAKREWGMVSNYNLMLDTSILNQSKCCDIIMHILKEEQENA